MVVAIAIGTTVLNCAADERNVVPPGKPIDGRYQADWSQAWWQWAASFDYSDSPVADATGAKCHLKQDGAVWFLAGTYGTRRTTRTCTVPRGKYLFFPLINYVVFPRDGETNTCASVRNTARAVTDQPSSLVFDLDGHRTEDLAKHRQWTRDCFDLGALTQPKQSVFPAAANGYYVMLEPLGPGKHVLNFGGVLGNMSQAVTYTLIVE